MAACRVVGDPHGSAAIVFTLCGLLILRGGVKDVTGAGWRNDRPNAEEEERAQALSFFVQALSFMSSSSAAQSRRPAPQPKMLEFRRLTLAA